MKDSNPYGYLQNIFLRASEQKSIENEQIIKHLRAEPNLIAKAGNRYLPFLIPLVEKFSIRVTGVMKESVSIALESEDGLKH